MKSTLRCAGIALILASVPVGLNAADTVSVDSILAQFVAANGGKAAHEKLTSRSVKARFEAPGMNTTNEFELLNKAPNKQWSKVGLGDAGTMEDGFDGKVAWSKSPFAGLRVKAGDELEKVKRDAEFHRTLRMKALYPDLEFKGKETVEGEEVRILESKPSASGKERFYFSAKSGLLVRQQSEYTAAESAVSVTVNFADYRAVDGVQYPYTMRMSFTMGGQEFSSTIKVKEVRHNVPVDDSKFAKPAE